MWDEFLRIAAMQIRAYQDADEPAVIALWKEVLPDSAPNKDPATMEHVKATLVEGRKSCADHG